LWIARSHPIAIIVTAGVGIVYHLGLNSEQNEVVNTVFVSNFTLSQGLCSKA
jgi:hypothetical protein